MPRTCTICTHPERAAIDQALAHNEPYRQIAKHYGRSDSAVFRHQRDHLPPLLLAAIQVEEEAQALQVTTELHKGYARLQLLFEACDRCLRDPDDPARYDIGPRADDVQVTYWGVGRDGNPVRKKARLSQLLARLETAGITVDRGETKYADPRELILKTADRLQSYLELMAKLLGELQSGSRIVNIFISPEWQLVREVLLQALQSHPAARGAVASALLALEDSHAQLR